MRPTCPIQSCTPCPMPGSRRPGKSRCSVASSMASSATLRSGTGARPMPTRTRSVHARAAPAAAIDDSLKQSSHSHSSSRCRSAAAASGRSASGGSVGTSTTPRAGVVVAVMAASPRAPGSPCSRSAGCTASRARSGSTSAGCPSPGCAARRGGRRRRAPAAGSQVRSRSWSTALPTRIGGLDQIRSNRTSSGMPSAVRRAHAVEPQRARVAPGQVERALVDVERPDRGGGGAQGQGERDRAPAAAEVEEGAGGGGAGASSSSTAVPLSSPPGEKMPGATSHLDVAAGEAHAQPAGARRRSPGRP